MSVATGRHPSRPCLRNSKLEAYGESCNEWCCPDVSDVAVHVVRGSSVLYGFETPVRSLLPWRNSGA